MLRIYVSSTFTDLVEERRAAKDAILALGHFPVGMEEYAASDERPVDRCLSDVDSCHAYVGIIAWKYGFRPNGGTKSITQLEYEAAEKMPRYIFLLEEDAPWPRSRVPDEDQPAVKAFREVLRLRHTIKHFRDKLGLALAVTRSLKAAPDTGAGMPSIPDLLPYLCDRSDQKYELSDALKRHTEVETDRPLLFIVHGNEMEAHDKFLERLQRVILPKLLPRQTERVGVPSYQLEWPSRFRTPKEMKNRLTFSLSMEVLGYDVNLLEEICAHLGEGPVIIHSHVITENWQQERMSGLDAFVEFWQDWPDLAVEQKLLVFLFVKYQGNKSFSPHKLRQYRRINREILEALEKYDFARVSRLTAAVLTELKGPTQDETEAWARSEEAGKFCDCQALVKATGEYYTQWAREHPRIIPTRIPTDELVPKLMEMISRTQLFRGKVA